MKPAFFRATGFLALAAVTSLGLLESHAATPNIVYILADDLGYGDLKCLNPESRIATPHMDKLAAEGMVFTDAHSTSSVCTPSRYSILTGRYSWRTRLQQAAAKKPFFLYLPLTSPHTPLAPTNEWEGKSGLGAYGDFLMQTDATVGQVLAALEQGDVAGNTFVILTSDNGFAPMAGNRELEKQGHFPSGPFRGYKSDIWEGGHRIPFIVRWPGTIRPGTRSGALTSLGDLMATCAEITGAKLPDTAGEDSISLLPVLRGESGKPARDSIVHHSNNGRFSIRQGKWKLSLCPGSGGWANPTDPAAVRQGLPAVQLIDLESDPGEKTNLQAEQPETVTRLTALLEEQIRNGRSTPGEKQRNDAEIVIHKPIVQPDRK